MVLNAMKTQKIKPDLKILFISFLANDLNFKDSIRERISDEIMLGKPIKGDPLSP